MIPPDTVLLLGAGASAPYGFPLGWELKDEILANLNQDDENAWPFHHMRFTPASLLSFREAFAGSRLPSIDAFLGFNEPFVRIGLAATAACLLRSERACRQRNFALGNGRGGDLYAYLWSRLATRSFEELDFSTPQIVSFNYDRSLEYYFAGAVKNTYAVTDEQAWNKLQGLQIVHVYGTLGSLDESDPTHVPFGVERPTPTHMERAIESLRVVPMTRDSDPSVERARAVLSAAKRLAILGFGFDELNLKRLNAGTTLAGTVPVPGQGNLVRAIATSCLGFTFLQARAIAKLCGQHNGIASTGLPEGYRLADAVNTLREELILGEWGWRG